MILFSIIPVCFLQSCTKPTRTRTNKTLELRAATAGMRMEAGRGGEVVDDVVLGGSEGSVERRVESGSQQLKIKSLLYTLGIKGGLSGHHGSWKQ